MLFPPPKSNQIMQISLEICTVHAFMPHDGAIQSIHDTLQDAEFMRSNQYFKKGEKTITRNHNWKITVLLFNLPVHSRKQ